MPKQLTLNIYKGTHGGRRPNSGRKRLHSKGVSHRTRERVTHRTPVHINFKVKTYIQNKDCLRALKRAIQNARQQGLRIVHWSLQSNHVHLILEPMTNEILTRGMRSLTITFAKRVQAIKKIIGGIQIERYHLHVLKSVNEAKNAVRDVLINEQKHTGRPQSSARYVQLDPLDPPITYFLSTDPCL